MIRALRASWARVRHLPARRFALLALAWTLSTLGCQRESRIEPSAAVVGAQVTAQVGAQTTETQPGTNPRSVAGGGFLVQAPDDVAGPAASARVDAEGVSSRRVTEGRGAEHPKDNDRVVLSYRSWRRDGTLVDSSGGASAAQTVGLLLRGLAVVVKTMVVGERRVVWMDASRTCIEQDEAEPPVCRGALTFELELLALQKAPATPAEVAVPPSKARRTPTGLAYEVLHSGPGGHHPTANSRVTVLHSGWTKDGVLFESSAMADQATRYVVHELPRGLREGVQLMTPGEKARFWIPASDTRSANRGPRPVKGPVVYDVELIAVD